jgi:uncharacterized membrane-anchored protein
VRQRLIVITRLFPGPEPVAAKVPTIGIGFWVVKVLTTGMGEAASDYLGKLNLLLAAVVGLGGIWYALRLQFRADRYRATTYWFAVALVAVFGTMAADTVHIVFFLPYPVTTTLYGLATAAALTYWYRSEGTLSIHSITSRRREQFYWTTVLATFALGTAAGDLTAGTLHLGFFASGLLFAAAIVVPALGWWRFNLNPVVAFWSAYVLTRPLGASFADWMGKPHTIGGGLGFGDGLVTAGASVLIVGGVYVLARTATASRHSVRPAAA